MKVLELFAGTRSIGRAFEARGHEVYSVEWDKSFADIDLYVDIGKLTPYTILHNFGRPDVIWASPDCATYSVAALGHHRDGITPKTEYARFCDAVNAHVVDLILALRPRYWFVENPRAMMRKMPFIDRLLCDGHGTRHTVTYCLAGETGIVTKNGVVPIREVAGTTQILLDRHGNWIEGVVRSYGVQPLMKITLSRAKKKKCLYATANHRWFANGKEKETQALGKGDRLDYSAPKKVHCDLVNEYVARGFVFGDGHVLKKGAKKAFAQFCGEKIEMLKYFDGIGGKRWRDDKDDLKRTFLYGCPREWKTDMPTTHNNPSEIYSWLAGYVAADGTVHNKLGQVTLSSSKKEDLQKVRDLCRSIGIDTYSIVEAKRLGFGNEETSLYQICFMKSDLTSDFLLRKKHKERFIHSGRPKHQPRRWVVISVEPTDRLEEVFCAEVGSSHSFVLDDGIVTHNCKYGEKRMKPTDIFTNHPDPRFIPPCKNGDPCHERAPRGSRTGTQGIDGSKDRARIPAALCNHIVEICEKETTK